MHDPSVLVISIRRPWPKVRRLDRPARKPAPGSWLARLPRWRRLLHRMNSPFWRFGRTELYWPSLIDVWHDEPGGRDALEVCRARISVDEYRQSWLYRLDPRVTLHRVSQEAADEAALGYREWVTDKRWRWHFRHMRIRVIPWLHLTRWLRSRCAHCARRFRYGEAPVSHSWGGDGPSLRRGEIGVLHSHCSSAVHSRATLERTRESYVRVIRRMQAALDWTDEDLLALLYQRPARPDGYGISADSHTVSSLLGWKFNDDMAVAGYELLHAATGRSTRPHDHPLPANATPTLAEAIQSAHADHVREHRE